jgi:hypothetical protein
LIIAVAVASFAPAGCGDEEDGPGEVVEEVFAAYNARDFGKVYDLSSQTLQLQAGTRDEAIAQMSSGWPQGTEVVDLEIVEETIDGDAATVKWSGTIKTPELPDEASSASVSLVREDGQWKLAS